MQNVLSFLHKDDPTFHEFKPKFECLEICKKSVAADIKGVVDKAGKDIASHKNQFETILKIDPEVETKPFGTKLKAALDEYAK